ncbi:hypothetical protein [Roseobacter sp. HKCCD7870]|uniref:hypothetical protein n=1 Tax=Roseobacter sp. HKCCD7870 TaxID=3120343 RepID=UPI0030EF47F7
MAVIGALGGLTALGQTVENISEVFACNAAAREAADAEFRAAARPNSPIVAARGLTARLMG